MIKQKKKKSIKQRIVKRFMWGVAILIFFNYFLDWALGNLKLNVKIFSFDLGNLIRSIIITLINLFGYAILRLGIKTGG
jgi:hypothetical protein